MKNSLVLAIGLSILGYAASGSVSWSGWSGSSSQSENYDSSKTLDGFSATCTLNWDDQSATKACSCSISSNPAPGLFNMSGSTSEWYLNKYSCSQTTCGNYPSGSTCSTSDGCASAGTYSIGVTCSGSNSHDSTSETRTHTATFTAESPLFSITNLDATKSASRTQGSDTVIFSTTTTAGLTVYQWEESLSVANSWLLSTSRLFRLNTGNGQVYIYSNPSNEYSWTYAMRICAYSRRQNDCGILTIQFSGCYQRPTCNDRSNTVADTHTVGGTLFTMVVPSPTDHFTTTSFISSSFTGLSYEITSTTLNVASIDPTTGVITSTGNVTVFPSYPDKVYTMEVRVSNTESCSYTSTCTMTLTATFTNWPIDIRSLDTSYTIHEDTDARTRLHTIITYDYNYEWEDNVTCVQTYNSDPTLLELVHDGNHNYSSYSIYKKQCTDSGCGWLCDLNIGCLSHNITQQYTFSVRCSDAYGTFDDGTLTINIQQNAAPVWTNLPKTIIVNTDATSALDIIYTFYYSDYENENLDYNYTISPAQPSPALFSFDSFGNYYNNPANVTSLQYQWPLGNATYTLYVCGTERRNTICDTLTIQLRDFCGPTPTCDNAVNQVTDQFSVGGNLFSINAPAPATGSYTALSYAIFSSVDLFTVDASTGIVTSTGALPITNPPTTTSYSITANVYDTAACGYAVCHLSLNVTFTNFDIRITNMDSVTLNLHEDVHTENTLHTITTSDANSEDRATCVLDEVNSVPANNGKFIVRETYADSGVYIILNKEAPGFDYGTTTSYTVAVTCSDLYGSSASATMTVNIDENAQPVLTNLPGSINVDPITATNGTEIFTLSYTDAENDAMTYFCNVTDSEQPLQCLTDGVVSMRRNVSVPTEEGKTYAITMCITDPLHAHTHCGVLSVTITSAYGARCDFYTVCLPKRAECIDGECICKTGVIDWKSNQCDTMPLSEYGTEEDTLVDANVACGGPVIFQPGFTVFGATRRSVHICSNGFVSLDKPYTGPKPPRNISTLGDFVLLAPYYADTSREYRKVYYRYFDITNNKGNGLNREDVVNITQFVRRFGGNSDFQPAFVLFVTWAKRRPFERSLNGTSTFQLILVSDGTKTFAVYIYGHGEMLWTSSLSRPAIWSGFYASPEQSEMSLYSFSQHALRMDENANTKGVQGVILHRLNTQGEVAPAQVTNGIKCHRWYNTNNMRQLDVTHIPECPCDLAKLWLDPWYTGSEDQSHTPDIACSTILAAGTFSPFGKNCCYNKTTGLLVQDRPYAGTVLQYHPRTFPREHQIHDIDAKTYCCNSSNFCDKYYELHPIGTCYIRSWFEIGTVWGDPHFRTLDNGSFTFNGLGEFHLLQVEKPNKTDGLFQLQARTERPLKPNNALSEATVFSAFAASDGMGADFHVQLNQNKSDFVIYGHGKDLSEMFRKQEFTYEEGQGNLTIIKRGETLTVGFPSFGIHLNVSINVRMFSIVVILNEDFIGRTRGLLGNFNGDPADDFVLPNGIQRQANMTEQEIYYYGMQWSVDSKSSVFFYPKGKGHSDYHNSSYVPKFLGDVSIEKRNNATERCGGESNVQCIFDFVFTEDGEIANITSNIDKTSLGDKKELKDKIPTIEGCELSTIKLGDEVVCQLNVSNETDTIFVDGLEAVSHTLNQNNYTLVFKIIDTKPVFISVSAHSNNGKKSPKKAIKILLCPPCSNHGVCSSSQKGLETYSSPFFKIAKCTCDTGYDGPKCDVDYDGCSSMPCSLLRDCTDLTPEEHVQRNISHMCGPCPEGYTTVDEDECVDIDECAEGSHGCQDMCINTDGGYECGCGTGYRLDTTNKRLCDDINECEEALHACEHECINANGSYQCTCRDGFSLDQTGLKCLQNDDDVCSRFPIDCSNADGCTIDKDETPVCFCKNGFRLTNNTSCEDIDECRGNICPQDCLNTIGSFQCMCHSGYRLAGKTTCVPCDYLSWGSNCSNTCDCPNANDCDTVKGCVCKKGWIGDRCDEDINECQINPNLCPDGRETCIDTDGSYYCACVDGYSRPEGSTLQCTDIDECSSPRLHDCEHFCNNTIGGYTCSCQEGHTYKNVTHCEDVNECDLKTAGCQHICENFKGGFNCYCEFGYILNDDRKTCTEDENPCLTANLTCSQVCITEIESRTPSCGCEPGYIMAADNVSCSDTNECEDTILNRCGSHSKCINEMGSFRCECQIGFKLQNDERTCQECDQFHYGEDCRNTCSCVRGNCDNEIGCICDGWTGDNCDQDLDECQTLTAPCGGDNVYCQNIPGGYMCRCLTGFHNISGTCEDIDECIQDNTNNCDQRCENSYGSYTCLCNNGFIRKNDHCEDIDECSKQHDCSQKCDNTIGNYRCSCKTGYKLDLSSRRSCSPITECNSTVIDLCESKDAYCSVIESKPICSCWKGYEDNSTSGSCSDIDDCIENPCEHTCENTDGDYSCSCYDGYKLDVDRTTCTECQPFYYGQECTQRCACNLTNTESCNNTNGICTCKEGWTSDDCSEDVDECMVGTHSCSDIINSECVNSPGSYMCTCLFGYTRESSVCIDINECMDGTGDCSQDCENTEGSFICKCSNGYRMDGGNCTECNDNKFGYNCSEQCTCYTNNTINTTQSCEPSTGICHCKQEWTDSNCSVDVNECVNTDLCNDVPFSDCHNIEGGYSCECLRGYTKDSNGECTTDDNVTVIIIVSAVGFVLIVSLIVLVVCLKVMRRRRQQKKCQNASLNDTSRRRVSFSNKSARGTHDRYNMSHVSAGLRHVGPSGSGNLEDQEIHKDRLQGQWHSGMGGRYIFYRPQLSTTVPTVAKKDSAETRNIDEESSDNAF